MSNLLASFFLWCLAAALLPLAAADPRLTTSINPGWRFWLGEAPTEAVQASFDDRAWDLVSLPHTLEVFGPDLKDFPERGRNLGWYRRTIDVPAGNKRVFLVFGGAMQTTQVWVNGKVAGAYAVSGYDSFHVDITPLVKPGRNLVAVRVDNTPNPDIPPDIRKTDFIQFGGLYRGVDLVLTDPVHITFPWETEQAGIRLTLPEISVASAVVAADTTVANAGSAAVTAAVTTTVQDAAGKVLTAATSEQAIAPGAVATLSQRLPAIAKPPLWSPAQPHLTTVMTSVKIAGREVDRIVTPFGLRWAEFTKDRGFFLNGQPLKLVGANRHQTWPWIGNAVPARLHRLDARLLKDAGFNWVRLSHYPHDPVFLAELDRLGLLALAEGPTWWGKGNAAWVANLERSFRSMIRRDRNHACLVVWNSCVNHGGGEKFLIEAAKAEDPTRARGQDTIPCPMNFKHGEVSGNGALTIEHTGHTFATKRGSAQEYELAKRHWEMVDAAYRKTDNCGLAVWAMFDYNTFHNADHGIAQHGVYDLFRLPKQTVAWHRSELGAVPVAHVLRVEPGKVCVFANGEQVRLSQDLGKGLVVVATQGPDQGLVLRHPPSHFAVDPQATAFKAESLVGGKVVATATWTTPGAAVALTLTTESSDSALTADGADIARLVVRAVDAQGATVEAWNQSVQVAVTGPAVLIPTSPVELRAGAMSLLVQAGFVPGAITVAVQAEGLKPATLGLKSSAVAAGVDLPKGLGQVPTRSTRIVIPAQGAPVAASWMAMAPRRDAEQGSWVESDPILVPKESDKAAISIRGGEYRIYTGAWTNAPGTVQSGDAVYVRVNVRRLGPSWADEGQPDYADLTIGKDHSRFEVTPKR